jgi:hypothetical protein
MDDKTASAMLTFMKSERAIDWLRWVVAFVAVVLAYGIAGWMLLRPTGWQLGVNGSVVEIDLRDLPQPTAVSPSDRASEPASPANPPGDSAQSEPPAGAAGTASRAASGSASRADGGEVAKDARAEDAPKDGSADAAKTAALDKAEAPLIGQPGPLADATPEAPPLPPPYPPPHAAEGREGADSGGGGRPPPALPRVAAPDTGISNAASIARVPIDTGITVNQGRGVLRSAKGGSQFRGVSPLQSKLTLPLATPNRSEIFSKKPNPIGALTLPAPGSTAPAANRAQAQNLAQRPASGADGSLARNAIGVVIEQRTVASRAGTPLGVHLLPGAMSAAVHASGEHSPATTAAGAPLAAGNTRPSDPGLSTGTANRVQAGHPDQALHASHVASIGGPAISGNGMSHPASATAALAGPAKVPTGGLNGSGFRPKYR